MRRVLLTVVFLTGCFDTPPAVRAQIACTTVCTCSQMPVQLDTCVANCVENSGLGTAPDECFECIQLHANQCSTLEADCEDLCEPPPPPPQEFPDGGMK